MSSRLGRSYLYSLLFHIIHFQFQAKILSFWGPWGFNFQTWDQSTLSSSKGVLQCTHLEGCLHCSKLFLRLGHTKRKTQSHSAIFTQKFFCFSQEMDPSFPYGCIFKYSSDKSDDYMERMRSKRIGYDFPK